MSSGEQLSWFDRFADLVAEVFAGVRWLSVCFGGFVVWLALGPAARFSQDWHLWANTPTTWLGFFGIFVLHNNTHRFEQATNRRLVHLEDHLPQVPGDPVDDEGQKPT